MGIPKGISIDYVPSNTYIHVFDERGGHLDCISAGRPITHAYCSGLQVVVEDDGNMVTTYDMSSGSVKRMGSRAMTFRPSSSSSSPSRKSEKTRERSQPKENRQPDIQRAPKGKGSCLGNAIGCGCLSVLILIAIAIADICGFFK